MSNPKHNLLRIYQGRVFKFTHILKQIDETPINLYQVNTVFQIRRNVNYPEVMLEASTYNGMITIPSPETGTVYGIIPSEETYKLLSDTAVFELLYIWPIDQTDTIPVRNKISIKGAVKVEKAIAKDWIVHV